MAKSLQEQLLEAGLVSREKAQKSKQAKHKRARRQRAGDAAATAEAEAAKKAAREAEEAKRAKDLERNRLREERAAKRALAAEIEQLVTTHRADRVPGDEIFQFVDGGKIKRVYVTPEVHAGLTAARYAIVRLRRNYAAVDQTTAARIAERDPLAVIKREDDDASAEQLDEYYAQFEIPDDLQW
ncbi:MAG: DUF2058 domain-containing protein [Gammaproteobacteria bacterium]|nr:DUF2058 domain-containing protein [Gammaproteobacteria bacterium]